MKTPQTSVPQLAKALGLPGELYLKREDLHPYGSHKGRSIPLMIKSYAKEGIKKFVISSSGNAALAAIHTVEQHSKNNPGKEISLHIFVGHHIDEKKLSTLFALISKPSAITIEQVDNPKQAAFQMDKAGVAKSLRQSTDDLALEGYAALAEELSKIDNLSAIFIPTSSGTTAQGLGAWFADHNPTVQIHIVQTEAVHPLANIFDTQFMEQDTSLASAIVDNVAHRKEHVIEIIRKSQGSGWIVSDTEIQKVIQQTKKTTKIDLSPNSALSIAGLKKAVRNGRTWPGPVVCLVTGA